MKLRTDLSRVLGLGSARSGAHPWLHQLLSAIALLPLGLLFVTALLTPSCPWRQPLNVTQAMDRDMVGRRGRPRKEPNRPRVRAGLRLGNLSLVNRVAWRKAMR